jgi:hypothetical protein
VIMLILIEPHLRRAERARNAYVEAFGVARTLDMALRGRSDYFSADTVALRERLEGLAIPEMPLAINLQPRSAKWMELSKDADKWDEFGMALATDPDAPAPV